MLSRKRRIRSRTPRCVLLWCWLALAQLGLAASPAGAETLIVIATLGETVLSEDFSVVRRDGQLYLPVVELGTRLLIPFESIDGRSLAATVTSTGSEIRIDPDQGVLQIDGVTEYIDASDFLLVGNRLFLAEDIVERIIPVEVAFNAPAMHLEVEATGPLPIEVRAKQEQLRERILDAHRTSVEPTDVDVPYAAVSMPVADVTINASRSGDGVLRRKYDALVGAEVGYLSTEAFVSGDERRPVADLRLRAGREDPEGGVFGVSSLTRAWAGDVRGPALPLLGGAVLGRGVSVSSRPLDRPDSFDATTIDGDAKPGWDVELYQNGMLIAHQEVGETGRFAFEDVPLLYGRNLFRLVHYGPQGQLREEERKVTVGGEMVTPGETQWSLFAGQPSTRVAAPLLVMPNPSDTAAFALEVERGISRNLSLGGFAARSRTSAQAGSDMVLSAGVVGRVSWRDMLFGADVALQENGGFGIDLSGVAAFDAFSLSARYARFQGFRSLAATDGLEPLTAIATARIQKTVPDSPIGPVTVGLRGEHRAYVNGRRRLTAGMDVRHRTGPVHVHHELGLSSTTHVDHDALASTSILYSPTFSLLRDPIWARGSARFKLGRESRLENLSASLRYRFDEKSSIGAELGYSLFSNLGQLNLSYARQFDFANASATAALHSDGELSLGVGLSFSLGVDRGGRPRLTADRLAERGAVAAFVYHDKDADGRFDADADTPLPDIGFRLDHGRRPPVRTDADGSAILGELSAARPLRVELDEATIPDPFWIAADGPLRVQPRRSRMFALEIPVVDSGEASGTISIATAAGELPLGGILVQLVGEDGRMLSDFRTDSEGFYLFERLRPGRYQVAVPDGQEIEDIPILAKSVGFDLAPGGTVVDGLDLVLDLDGELEMPSVEDDEQFFELFGEPLPDLGAMS